MLYRRFLRDFRDYRYFGQASSQTDASNTGFGYARHPGPVVGLVHGKLEVATGVGPRPLVAALGLVLDEKNH